MQSTTYISNNNDNNENKYKKDQGKLQNTLLQDLENTFSSILALRNLALKDDEHLLNFMLNESKYSDKFKQAFFKEISFSINQRGGTLGRLAGAESPSDSSPTLIFLKEKFLSFLQSRVLNHSYTFYTNKIGLGSKARVFIKQDTKLVLNFPFKDCLLKGAQTKDEKKTTQEILFNEILAKDEIDAIFYEPKVLCNFRDISKDSISSPATPSDCTLNLKNDLAVHPTLKGEGSRGVGLENKTLKGGVRDSNLAGGVKVATLDGRVQGEGVPKNNENIESKNETNKNLDSKDSNCAYAPAAHPDSKDSSPAPLTPPSKVGDTAAHPSGFASLDTPPARLKPYTFFTRDPAINKARGTKENTITDNLLIKGNNLIALHSLKSQFRGQVKLIYIDPPYNTGNDSFNYNDNFNHSTWLVFMKNRLEIARELLRDDGVIFIQCDDNEQAYLKVLCDEIFGRGEFVNTLHVELSTTQGMKVASAQKGKIVKNAEYILVYAKNAKKFSFVKSLYTAKSWDEHYSIYIDSKTNKRDTLLNFLKSHYENINKEKIVNMYENDDDFRIFIHKNAENIMRDAMCDVKFNFSKEQEKALNNNEVVDYKNYKLIKTSTNIIRQLLPLSKAIGETNDFEAKFGLRKIRGDWWGGYYKDMMNINKEANIVWKAGKKPERLIKDIIEISTKENDLVLDFFAGSGTTAAVAHKMKRQYIAIEQMDYIESITLKRLEKVIAGEQGGVSKALNWQGGGGFKYFELMGLNAIYKHKIENLTGVIQAGIGLESNNENIESNELVGCQTNNENIESNLKINEELNALYKELESKAFLDYRMDIKEMLKDEDFDKLDLENKKRVLYTILDANMDYIPLCDMQDKRYKIDDDVIKMNMDFYGDEI